MQTCIALICTLALVYCTIPQPWSPAVHLFIIRQNEEATCYDLSELGVQVNCTGEKGADVSSGQHWSAGGQKHLEATHISIDLQQRLHVFSRRNVFGNPVIWNKDGQKYSLRTNWASFHDLPNSHRTAEIETFFKQCRPLCGWPRTCFCKL